MTLFEKKGLKPIYILHLNPGTIPTVQCTHENHEHKRATVVNWLNHKKIKKKKSTKVPTHAQATE